MGVEIKTSSCTVRKLCRKKNDAKNNDNKKLSKFFLGTLIFFSPSIKTSGKVGKDEMEVACSAGKLLNLLTPQVNRILMT